MAPPKEKPKVESEKVNPETFKELEKQVDGLVQSSKDRLKDLPKSFQDSLHDNVVQYLRTSVERYDTDSVAGLNKEEFARYKRDMLQKVGDIIARYAPSAETLKAREQQKEGAAKAAEVAKKSATTEVKDTKFNEKNLQTPQGIREELEKFNAQSADVQKEIGTLSTNIVDFQRAYQRFEEWKKEWSVFLRGSPFTGDSETEQLKTQLENLKRKLDEKIQKLQEKKHAIAEYGKKLNETGDTMKSQKVAGEQALASLETQRQSLNAISIDRPNIWNATGGLVFGKIGEGWNLLTKDVICGSLLDPASAWLKKVTKDVPVINVITEVGANVIIDLPSGLIEGSGELINGIATMVAHPVDTLAGMGTLIGRNPQTGEWSPSNAGDGWRGMGKALIAYENFERGEVGKGVGKVALNVLLTATGVGAATKGAQGASIAYSVARTSGAGAARATLRATGTGARLFAGEFSGGIAKLPGETLSATGKLLRAPRSLVQNMKLGTTARLGKEISEAGGELTKVSAKLDGFTVSGKKVSELEVLRGKTSRDLAKLAPKDLAKAGIKDSGTIREFLEYKSVLQKSEKLQGSIQTLGFKKFAVEQGEKLERLDNKGLIKLADRYNDTHPPIPKSQIKEKAFQIFHQNENGIVVINEKGQIGVYKTIEEFRLDRAKISPDKILQQDVKILPKADTFGIKGPDGAHSSFSSQLHFQKTYEELSKLTPEQLAEYGIKTEEAVAEFNRYVDYVRSVEAEVVKLRNGASEAKKVLDAVMDDVAARTEVAKNGTDLIGNGSPQTGIHKAPIKGVGRTLQKCLDPLEYNGNAAELVDLARGTLEYESVTELNKAMKLIKEDPRVRKIRIKDNMGDPLKSSKHPVQYRDVNISMQLEGGQVVELQLHIKEMLTAKEIGMRLPPGTVERIGFVKRDHQLVEDIARQLNKPNLKIPKDDFVKSHELYEIARAIPDTATDELICLRSKLNDLATALHKYAWNLYLKRTML